MPVEEIDLVDEILGADLAAQWVPPGVDLSSSTSSETTIGISPWPARGFRAIVGRVKVRMPRSSAAGFALAFGIAAVACLTVFVAAALVAYGLNSGRVVAGIHAGAVDLSGLRRDQVIARLNATYAYLGQGEVTVTTPDGNATITYRQLGRAADVEFMADDALGVGHSGNPIADALTAARTLIYGHSVPVVVRLDPTAIAASLRNVAGANQSPQDAQAVARIGTFTYSPSAVGNGIDEAAISNEIIDKLVQPDAPGSFQVGGSFVTLQPRVNDRDAQAAIDTAQKMVVAINLSFGGSPQPGSSAQATAIPPRTVTIAADTVRAWIVFDSNRGSTYGPSADPALIEGYLAGLSAQIRIAPVEPTTIFNGSGFPTSFSGGKDGTDIDVAATAGIIEAYLNGLAAGGTQVSTVAVVTKTLPPNITIGGVGGLTEIGGWTTTFYPDISNGNGANIRIPARLLNGQLVLPGQQFSFLGAVGPIDEAHGFALGGVIEHGKSNHTGAIGGGICSASTTMFNAAARAGLTIDERHAHYYYIDRYPVGLDATVFSDGYQVWDLKWTNDTPNPILILAGSTTGSKSTVTMELWSLPLGRTVTFSPEFKANVVKSSDATEYVSSLAPGQQARAEYPTDGFETSRTRTVTDSTGAVIHTDTWASHYTMVNGLLLIGRSTPAAPTPTPTPKPKPKP